ncbi:TonB-dependent receptor [Altererythrobacter xixiisoli]|uniref:TonB-dependent receptor n=1 Tax=Croceibacterium xixiisoli TaxID=1476466 RepID=A0A6I4TT82_9SPHN|nr:TonB-dependent receptor [Croceibacterium xixiisoli]MXO98331.1 TonB-dependent receptor [Croceibacterium xixiisoli]
MTRNILLTAASMLAVSVATPALANESELESTDSNAIIVTAQLREQALVEVPVAITAYDGEFIEQLGLNDFEEISRFVPGFVVQNQSPNNAGFVMRGITSDSGAAYVEPRVSVFQDGVSISKSRGSYVELFDMERVEIARGPQSTLYGRGALIGAVNLVQNKADPSAPAGLFRGSYGNNNAIMAEAMVNMPLNDKAALRVSGRLRERDGFIPNLLGGSDFNSVNTFAIRSALRLEPSDRVSVDIIGNYQEDNPAGTSFKSLSYNPTDPTTGALLGTSEPWTGAALAPGEGFEGGAPLGLDRKVGGVTGIIRAELSDSFSLTSISAWRQFDSLEIFDADGISLPALTAAEDAHGEQFSQELRLTYQSDSLTAFLGASYFRDKGYQRTPSQFDERVLLARLTNQLNGGGLIPGRAASDPAPMAVLTNPAFSAALLQGVAGASGVALSPALAQAIATNLKSGHYETSTNHAETESFDIFADVSLQLTDRLEVGAGGRYSHDSKTSSISSAVLNGRSILGGFIGALSQAAPTRTALLNALAVPGAAGIPPSAGYPVPLFGLGSQPTANNGDLISADLNNGGFTWRAFARYELAPDASIYANYARGRRPQVLSALTPSTPTGAARFDVVEAETVDSFELGARTQSGDLYLDGSVFYYSYNNFQTTVQQGTQFVVVNAGKADAYGFEGQARWRANDNISLLGTYAYNHSRFRTGVRDGNQFRLSPDHSFSFAAMFGLDAGPGRLSFTPSVTWQSRIFFDDDNDRPDLQTTASGALIADLIQDETQGSYALVNARLGYALDSGLEVEAFVTNLLKQNYIKDAGNTGDALGMPTFIAGEPRFYGVQVTKRF